MVQAPVRSLAVVPHLVFPSGMKEHIRTFGTPHGMSSHAGPRPSSLQSSHQYGTISGGTRNHARTTCCFSLLLLEAYFHAFDLRKKCVCVLSRVKFWYDPWYELTHSYTWPFYLWKQKGFWWAPGTSTATSMPPPSSALIEWKLAYSSWILWFVS